MRVCVVGILRGERAFFRERLPERRANERDAGVGFGIEILPEPRHCFSVERGHAGVERDKLFAVRFVWKIDRDARGTDRVFPTIADEHAVRETRKQIRAEVLNKFRSDFFFLVGLERQFKRVPIHIARGSAIHDVGSACGKCDGLAVGVNAERGKFCRVKGRARAGLRGKADDERNRIRGVGVADFPRERAAGDGMSVCFGQVRVHSERGQFDDGFAVERREGDENVLCGRLRGERRDERAK